MSKVSRIRRNYNRTLGIGLLLLLAVLLVFCQSARFAFVNFDDDAYVYNNPKITKGLNISGIEWAFTHVHSENWHPVTTISHMLNFSLFGLRPAGHHLVNVAFHALAAVLLFTTLREMTAMPGRSAWVAAAWAIHPLRAESVAWVSEMKDDLSGFFFMLTLLAYVRHARSPATKGWYYWALVLFAAGLLCKPILVTVPFLLLLLDFWPLGRHHLGPRRLLIEKLPFIALSAASCFATVFAQKGALKHLENITFPWRAGNAAVSIGIYIWKTFVPCNLAVLYPHPGVHLPVFEIVLNAGLVTAISWAAIHLRRKYPWLWTGWFWFLGMLVPVLGFMQVGVQAYADRYTYLPQIGLLIAIAWEANVLFKLLPNGDFLLKTVGIATIGGLMAIAMIQTAHWRNSETLWRHTLAVTTNNSRAHQIFGLWLQDQQRFEEACEQQREALQISENDADAHNNLANALVALGRIDEAIPHYTRATALAPDSMTIRINLARLLGSRGRDDEALACLNEGLRLQPNSGAIYIEEGMIYAARRRYEEAVSFYRKALEVQPDIEDALIDWGLVLAAQGKLQEAIERYNEALKLNPNSKVLLMNYAAADGQLGRLDDAIERYNQLLRIDPDSAKAHQGLGLALSLKGIPCEAIVHYQKAAQLFLGANPVIFLLLADECAKVGRMQEAGEALIEGKALQATKNNPPLMAEFDARFANYGKMPQRK